MYRSYSRSNRYWASCTAVILSTGVKRISVDTYDEARTALSSFLRTILKDVGVITEGARRMTVTVPDVLMALKRNGRWERAVCKIHQYSAASSCDSLLHRNGLH